MECPARHLQDSPGQERNFLYMRARAVSRPAITTGSDGFGQHRLSHGEGGRVLSCAALDAGVSAFPMMGKCVLSRAALNADSSTFPIVGEHAVSRAAFTAGGSVSP